MYGLQEFNTVYNYKSTKQTLNTIGGILLII